MSWIWPFNGRSGNGHGKNGDASKASAARPDFLCVGVHKGGTTWLYQQLDSHPDFWMPPLKELHYLDQLSRVKRVSSPRCRDERDRHFLESINNLSAKRYLDLEHYGQLFQPKGALLSGDISPNYSTLSNEVIRRVTRYFPNLKVIFLARDPVERLWSHLSMEVHYHQIEAFDVTDIDEVNRQLLRRGLLLRSYPSTIVARWKRYVHPDRFRIYFFDDLQRDPKELRRTILDFLGADPNKADVGVTAEHNSWATMGKLPLTEKVRSHLAQFFKKELKTCATRLGGAARDWPTRYGFSLVLFMWDLLDDRIDFFFWVDWIC
jgi:sulfotransferase family protein